MERSCSVACFEYMRGPASRNNLNAASSSTDTKALIHCRCNVPNMGPRRLNIHTHQVPRIRNLDVYHIDLTKPSCSIVYSLDNGNRPCWSWAKGNLLCKHMLKVMIDKGVGIFFQQLIGITPSSI